MTAKEISKSGDLIEMMMSDKRRSNVKGDNSTKMETEDRLIGDVNDSEQSCEQKLTPFCRICFDDEISSSYKTHSSKSCFSSGPAVPVIYNPLLKPCLCSGTAATVHLTCLQKWQAHSKSEICELCRAPFQIPEQNESPLQATTGRPLLMMRQFFKRLVMLLMLLFLQLLPIAAVVIIMTIPVDNVWEISSESNPGWGMFGRSVLSVVVCLLYIPLLYFCLYKHKIIFNSHSPQNTTSFSSRGPPYAWQVGHEDRSYHYLEAAFM